MDVPAPFAGIVTQLSVGIGDRVSEGSVLLMLESRRDAMRRPTGGAPGIRAPDGRPGARSRSRALPAPPSADGRVRPRRPGGGARRRPRRLHGRVPRRRPRAEDDPGRALRALGGVCLNVGCIPSKALLHAARVIAEAQEMGAHGITFGKPQVDLDALRGWKQSVVDKLTGGLRASPGSARSRSSTASARFTGPNTRRRSATARSRSTTASSPAARRPHRCRDLPDDRRIVTPPARSSSTASPKRLLVIGGGIIGLEMATVYDALGLAGHGRRAARPADPGMRPGPRQAAAASGSPSATRRSTWRPRSRRSRRQKTG